MLYIRTCSRTPPAQFFFFLSVVLCVEHCSDSRLRLREARRGELRGTDHIPRSVNLKKQRMGGLDLEIGVRVMVNLTSLFKTGTGLPISSHE